MKENKNKNNKFTALVLGACIAVGAVGAAGVLAYATSPTEPNWISTSDSYSDSSSVSSLLNEEYTVTIDDSVYEALSDYGYDYEDYSSYYESFYTQMREQFNQLPFEQQKQGLITALEDGINYYSSDSDWYSNILSKVKASKTSEELDEIISQDDYLLYELEYYLGDSVYYTAYPNELMEKFNSLSFEQQKSILVNSLEEEMNWIISNGWGFTEWYSEMLDKVQAATSSDDLLKLIESDQDLLYMTDSDGSIYDSLVRKEIDEASFEEKRKVLINVLSYEFEYYVDDSDWFKDMLEKVKSSNTADELSSLVDENEELLWIMGI